MLESLVRCFRLGNGQELVTFPDGSMCLADGSMVDGKLVDALKAEIHFKSEKVYWLGVQILMTDIELGNISWLRKVLAVNGGTEAFEKRVAEVGEYEALLARAKAMRA